MAPAIAVAALLAVAVVAGLRSPDPMPFLRAQTASLRGIPHGMTMAAANRATLELRNALAKLPLAGKILAAWGLAEIAKRAGDEAGRREMRAFIEKHAPHLKAVLERV